MVPVVPTSFRSALLWLTKKYTFFSLEDLSPKTIICQQRHQNTFVNRGAAKIDYTLEQQFQTVKGKKNHCLWTVF